MPQTYLVDFDPALVDIAGVSRTDGLVELLSDDGYGLLVLESAEAAIYIGMGGWTDVTP